MEDEQAAEPSWFRKTLHSGGSAFLIAFICNKATFPIRAPITVGLTPMVARCVVLFAWMCVYDRMTRSSSVMPCVLDPAQTLGRVVC